MNDLVAALLGELEEAISIGLSLGADDFPQDTSINPDQSVSWVSSVFDGSYLVNIFKVSESGTHNFIGSSHSDGGAVVKAHGPWSSLESAEASFGELEEEWTRL